MNITAFNQNIQDIVLAIQLQGYDLGGYVLVAHEGHATIQLKDKSGIWIVAVMPSTSFSGEPDTATPHETGIILVLEKDIDDQTRSSELDQYQRTQDIVTEFVAYLEEQRAAGCTPFHNFDLRSTTIDPEYREFGGWNGWSMTLSW